MIKKTEFLARKLIALLLMIIIVILILVLHFQDNRKTYTDEDFGIKTLISDNDCDNDGIDDYTDILIGAKEYMKDKPPYKSKYYVGGYPDDEYAVCTDLIWYALQNAGYDLKLAVDLDISENTDYYFDGDETPDSNIDFRRVRNLKKFFEKNEQSLTLDTSLISEWQRGDIVTFSESHIAIISDKRNKDGVPYIIHQSPRRKAEADLLNHYTIDGHFRITGEYKYGK